MFKNLSRQFDVRLDIKRFIEKDDVHDSCIVKATILDKKSKHILDSLFVTSLFFYTNYYDIPSHIVSYSTRTHVFKEIVDNYAGDLVVDDLNVVCTVYSRSCTGNWRRPKTYLEVKEIF